MFFEVGDQESSHIDRYMDHGTQCQLLFFDQSCKTICCKLANLEVAKWFWPDPFWKVCEILFVDALKDLAGPEKLQILS